MVHSISDILKTSTILGASWGAASGVANWLGHSITHVGFLHSVGFGVVFGISTTVAIAILNKMQVSNKSVHAGVACGIGAGLAYSVSAAAAALGFAAAPITVPGAILLAASSLSLSILFGMAIEISKECCEEHCEGICDN